MKKFLTLALILSMCTFFSFADASAKQVLKLGMGDPIDSDQGALATRFKEILEGLSNGEIQVDLFPNGAIGTETEMLQNTRAGTLDFAIIGIGNAVPFVRELGTLTMPYLIENSYDAVKATTGKLGKFWNTVASEKGGFCIVGWTYSNFRHLTNSVRPVTSLKDVKGLKIRIPQNNIILSTLKAWDANPVPMAWSETFTALQQGVVEGQDNPYIVNYTSKFHEVQTHLTEIHYQYSLQPLVMGTVTLDKFSPEMRNMVLRAGIEAQQYCILFQTLEAEKAKQAMQANGVKVSYLTDEDEWRKKAVETVWPQFYDFIGGKQNLDLVLKALGKS